MTQQKYIGLENELTSFNNYGDQGFSIDDFKKLLKGKYFKKSNYSIRSDTGNGYYVDGAEIEIVTPPIALNRGFATRLTNALLIGRNHIIKNTPYFNHTGYSMHWNLSNNDSDKSDFNLFDESNEFNKTRLIHNLYVPFQLFGLTPLSLGFNVRTDKYSNRYELLGDSLMKNDQINAAALLLGAYSAATENTFFKKNNFPISILKINNDKNNDFMLNELSKGRYSTLEVKIDNKKKITQAQNVLELFYEWINPFVYRLGERDEINNLEAFIKGDKKLEMDDLKYFNILKQNEGLGYKGTYLPIEISTQNFVRSQILKINLNEEHQIPTPIEGKLLGVYASNNKNSKIFNTKSMNWNAIEIDKIIKEIKKYKILFVNFEKKIVTKETGIITGVHNIYKFAEQYLDKTHLNESYSGGINTIDVKLNKISKKKINTKLRKKITYYTHKDLSVCVMKEI